MTELPERVSSALERARSAGFEMSCDPGVGELLALLAAAVPQGGRILELGTGSGVGLAWLVTGVGARTDVRLVSVDIDRELQESTRSAGWPGFVEFRLEDGAEVVENSGHFDLIFADAPGGKLTGLEAAIAALTHGGVFVVDDMDLTLHDDPDLRDALGRVRERLVGHRDLLTVELAHGSGVILAVRRVQPHVPPREQRQREAAE